MMTIEALKRVLAEASRVFVLTDDNVAAFWLPELKHWLGCEDSYDLVIKAGEEQKNLRTVQRLWKTMLKQHADRHSVMVNLGGGVITDLGGFTASCYQRGIPFVNVPTSLLGMVDAAFGGKTGVDFAGCKNQIGTFAEPLEVLVSPVFLSTLPDRELRSGLAEMLKYGFIVDPSMLKVDLSNYEQYLLRAGQIKRDIVARDFNEQGCRKALNFGHSVGHAIESWSLQTDHPLRHGEAIAIGMACSLWISNRMTGLSEAVLHDYLPKMQMLLGGVSLPAANDVDQVLAFLVHDKKNRIGELRFVLLQAPGEPVWDRPVPMDLVRQSFLEVMEQTHDTND